MTMKFDIDVLSIHKATKPWSPNFDIYFQIWIMLQSFLIGRKADLGCIGMHKRFQRRENSLF